MNARFAELKSTGRMPTPRGIAMSILSITRNEDFCMNRLAEILRSDPALTGRLLKLANSAAHARVSPVTSVEEAVMRIGNVAVRSIALSFSLMSWGRMGLCQSFDYEGFWQESLARGVSCAALARQTGISRPADAFMCGLLSMVGKLALVSVHPDSYSEVLENRERHPESSLVELERKQFGIDHVEVSLLMLRDWGVEGEIGEAVERQAMDLDGARGLNNLEDLLKVSGVLSEFLASPPAKRWGLLGRFGRARTATALGEAEFYRFSDRWMDEWREWVSLLDMPVLSPHGMEALVLGCIPPEEPKPHENQSPARAEHADARRGGLSDFTRSFFSEAQVDRKLKVLAVDDDPGFLHLLQRELEDNGYEVITATDGESALKLALDENPRFVVTDWNMPEMDGLELCRSLRKCEVGREMYVVMLTSYDQEELLISAFAAGADDYVTKPFNSRELSARLRAGLRVMKLQERIEDDWKRMQSQVSEMGILNRRNEEMSLTDELTGLSNRRHAMIAMKEAWEASETGGEDLSLIMLDIDHFKSVNDNHGHDVGDLVLKEVASRIGERSIPEFRAFRTGGEEFLVVCGGVSREDAAILAESIRQRVRARPISAVAEEIEVTVSAGVATRETGTRRVEDILRAADQAVYAAKQQGRDRAVMAG